MSDLIDRQEAVQMAEDIIGESAGYKAFAILHMLKELPPVEPKTHEKRTKTHACDCISRQAAIDAITEIDDGFNMDIYTGEVKELLRDLPSAEPSYSCGHEKDAQPRMKGKWIERNVTDAKYIEEWQSARCSVCGLYHTTPYMYFFDQYNFCPSCGADMRGEEDES